MNPQPVLPLKGRACRGVPFNIKCFYPLPYQAVRCPWEDGLPQASFSLDFRLCSQRGRPGSMGRPQPSTVLGVFCSELHRCSIGGRPGSMGRPPLLPFPFVQYWLRRFVCCVLAVNIKCFYPFRIERSESWQDTTIFCWMFSGTAIALFCKGRDACIRVSNYITLYFITSHSVEKKVLPTHIFIYGCPTCSTPPSSPKTQYNQLVSPHPSSYPTPLHAFSCPPCPPQQLISPSLPLPFTSFHKHPLGSQGDICSLSSLYVTLSPLFLDTSRAIFFSNWLFILFVSSRPPCSPPWRSSSGQNP